MKIAVIGSSGEISEETAKKAREIGKEIAKNNLTLITGATTGASYEAAKEALKEKGLVIGISPAIDVTEHEDKYDLPTDAFTEIIYTGLGYKGRNVIIVRSADAIIMISGKAGTLNEFTIAYDERKLIGVLAGTGGITDLIPKIAMACNKTDEMKSVIYSSEGKHLVQELINRFISNFS